jgi:hypothetical protein
MYLSEREYAALAGATADPGVTLALLAAGAALVLVAAAERALHDGGAGAEVPREGDVRGADEGDGDAVGEDALDARLAPGAR